MTSSRFSFLALTLSLLAASCSAFLRAGHVEDTPAGRKLVLPVQEGQYEANGFTKSMEPGFVRDVSGQRIVLTIVLTPHARALESYLPTACDHVVVSRTETDGVAATVHYEDQGGGRELFVASYAAADLKPFANDGAVDVVLCNYKYRFGGYSLEALLK